jgi:cell division protein FtsQ
MPVEQGRSRRRSAPPANVPRVAAIGGAFSNGPRNRITLRSVMMGLAGLVLFGGAAVAGAAWTGGSLFDAHEAMVRSTDQLAANSGFAVNTDEVVVTGVAGARADEVRAVINPDGRRSLLSMDPADVKARVESLDWVESARVRRLWPGKLDIHVERREALARWRDSGAITVIDFNGERLLAERAEDNGELPLVEGEGAAPAASTILAALEDLPNVRARVANLVRIGERRWNLELRNGAVAKLPENEGEMLAALRALEQQQVNNRLLERAASFDLRLRGLLAIRVEPELAGGPIGPSRGV